MRTRSSLPSSALQDVGVTVFGRRDAGGEQLLATGEAKWLLCFSGVGFSDGLRRAAAQAPDVELIDVARLYRGA